MLSSHRLNRLTTTQRVVVSLVVGLLITVIVLLLVVLIHGRNTFHTADLFLRHRNITTTVFWVGEPADSDNGGIANMASAWDEQWQSHYGGLDSADKRQGYVPAGFTPRENPFYIALPYNDADENGARKATALQCQMITQSHSQGSWCKNAWIAITAHGKTVYAQWQDVGPFQENDPHYVFGTARPHNNEGEKAGLDVSPAVRDYLKLEDVSTTTWQFVKATDVPEGPWKQTITTSSGFSID